ncbi:hypothetical protein KC480_05420 [Bacillus velezensis]|uniref:hypothetical protein n=1 Tax=Bacillus velezensis TaxID=492670 RepID=UPI001E3A67DB|nr:hypothetical protein [Bacillus velezensis]MCD7910964.1 hypothetical protein [Bacillus velezensis]
MAYVRTNPDYPKFRMKKGVMPDFSGAKIADGEIPSGKMDGANTKFELTNRPLKGSEKVFKDGLRMGRSSSSSLTDGDYYMDYDNKTLIFSKAQIPQENSVIRVDYKYMKIG